MDGSEEKMVSEMVRCCVGGAKDNDSNTAGKKHIKGGDVNPPCTITQRHA
jgi:hypothetical protein